MHKELPMEWVEKIFMRLHGRFGNQFFDKYKIGQINDDGEDIGILNAKKIWAEDCGHLTAERLRRGLEAKYQKAPSCDDFIAQCKPTEPMYQDNDVLKLTTSNSREKNAEYSANVIDFVEKRQQKRTDYHAWFKRILANPKRFPEYSVSEAKRVAKEFGYDVEKLMRASAN